MLSNLFNCQLSCLVFLSDTFQFDGFILSPVSAFPLKFQSFVNIWFIAFQEIKKPFSIVTQFMAFQNSMQSK